MAALGIIEPSATVLRSIVRDGNIVDNERAHIIDPAAHTIVKITVRLII